VSANIFLVARIVKQVTGKGELEMDGHVDTSTAAWLTETYSFVTKRAEDSALEKTADVSDDAESRTRSESQELFRLMQGHANVDPAVVNSWDFDVLKFSTLELMEVCSYVFDVFHLFDEFKCPAMTMSFFLGEVSSRYKENPYHNFQHAMDVTQTVYRFISVTQLNTILSPLEVFSLLLAAVGHDLGHPGVNNAFLVKTKDDLALKHNDK
jgi:hypothetical protein